MQTEYCTSQSYTVLTRQFRSYHRNFPFMLQLTVFCDIPMSRNRLAPSQSVLVQQFPTLSERQGEQTTVLLLGWRTSLLSGREEQKRRILLLPTSLWNRRLALSPTNQLSCFAQKSTAASSSSENVTDNFLLVSLYNNLSIFSLCFTLVLVLSAAVICIRQSFVSISSCAILCDHREALRPGCTDFKINFTIHFFPITHL